MSDAIGRRGENAVSTILGRPAHGKPMFKSIFLGDKAELLDFIVNLTDENEMALGPSFFLQVKASAVATTDGAISARFSAIQVSNSLKRQIPVYVVGVDVQTDDTEKAYFLSVNSGRTSGISNIPRTYDLSCHDNLTKLYEEVTSFFDSRPYNFVSNFTRK